MIPGLTQALNDCRWTEANRAFDLAIEAYRNKDIALGDTLLRKCRDLSHSWNTPGGAASVQQTAATYHG